MVTGHSLGGALATIFIPALLSKYKDRFSEE